MKSTWTPEETLRKIPMPVIEQIDGGTLGKPFWKRVWIYFTEPTKYKIAKTWKIELPNGMKIMFPVGFPFDGASIPWFLRWLATSFGPLLRGAVPHDGGYRYDYLLDWNGHKFAIGRGQKFYDDLFRDIVIWTTGMKVLAWWAWSGVRTFGIKAWGKHRRNNG